MNTWRRRARITMSSPLIAITPVCAIPPQGHSIYNELTICCSEQVGDETLGKLCRLAPTLSHYDLKERKETIDLDDFAKLLRVRSAFAIDKKLPEVDITLGDDESLTVCPLVKNGLGKKWATEHKVSLLGNCTNQELAKIVRAHIVISAESLVS